MPVMWTLRSDLLEPALEQFPRSAELFGTAGIAYMAIGDIWSAISCFEHANKLQSNPHIFGTPGTTLPASRHDDLHTPYCPQHVESH